MGKSHAVVTPTAHDKFRNILLLFLKAEQMNYFSSVYDLLLKHKNVIAVFMLYLEYDLW